MPHAPGDPLSAVVDAAGGDPGHSQQSGLADGHGAQGLYSMALAQSIQRVPTKKLLKRTRMRSDSDELNITNAETALAFAIL